jgi:hypothetical protein
MKKQPTPKQQIIDTMLNMVMNNLYSEVNQILFNPTEKQQNEFWCNKCDGFHNTSRCKLK